MPVPILKLCPPAEVLTPDADLLGRFASARDEPAFAELVRRHGPLVYRVCRRLSATHADDAFQAVFLVLACRAGRVRTPAAIGSWLIGVAGRVARQMRAAESRRANHEQRAGRAEAQNAPLDPGALAAALDEELARLPDALRAPVVLCLVGGRTHAQAAGDLGGSVRTLRRRLDRAKALLRARLERRGIVPAVAVALVAGAGSSVGAVPTALIQSTVSGMLQFLDGDAPPTAAVAVAKGVMDGMAKLKVSVLMATAAAVLVCLGVTWSQDKAPTNDPFVPSGSKPLAAPPATVPTPIRPGTPEMAPGDSTAMLPGGARSSVQGPNFVVHAPTQVMARVIAAEAEYHRRALALKWLGKELPQWSKPCVIRFSGGASGIASMGGMGGNGGASTFTFEKDKNGNSAMKTAEMELRGDFMATLNATLPHEVTHTVLASYFGRPLPRWADEGISLLSEGDDEQFAHDMRLRELLNIGRGIRLKRLLLLNEYPKDVAVLYAQGHSFVRFLVSKSAPTGVPVLKDLPYMDKLFQYSGADGHRRLIAFIHMGLEGNTAESWGKAAKTVYGFDSVDALEEDWLDWLKQPKSVIPRKPGTSRPAPLKPETPDLIPPVKLPTAPPAAPFGQDIGTTR